MIMKNSKLIKDSIFEEEPSKKENTVKRKKHPLLQETTKLKQHFIFSEILKKPYDL